MLFRMAAVAMIVAALPLPAGAEDGSTGSRATAICERQGWTPREDEDSGDDLCFLALAFDPTTYFESYRDGSDPLEAGGLVDAVFRSPFQGVEWAFAIKYDCLNAWQCPTGERRMLLRAVSIRTVGEMPRGWKYVEPRSKQDMLGLLSQTTQWREADLQTCPGALDQLLAIEKMSWMSFDDFDRGLIADQEPGDLVVMADGFSITVRASSGMQSSVSRDKGFSDEPGGWAIAMMDLVEPCLKPTAAPAPWAEGVR